METREAGTTMDKLQQRAFALSARVTGGLTRLRRYPQLRALGKGAQRFALCAVLARATLFGSFSPFAVAMTGALSALGGGFAGVLGAFFGYLLLRTDLSGIGSCAAALLTMACGHIFSDFAVSKSRWFMPMIASICTAACGFVFLAPIDVRNVVLFACTVVLTFGASYFYLLALSPPRREGDLKRPGGVLVLVATVLVSLSDLTALAGIAPARIAALALVMAAAYLTGSTGGAAAGVAFGVTMDAAGSGSAFYTCVYGFAALIAGVFEGAGRVGFAVIYLCASAAASMLGAEQPQFVTSLAESAAAALLFALVPDKLWQMARELLMPGTPDAEETVRRVRQSVRRYAGDTAQAVYEMYLGMLGGAKHGAAGGDEDAHAVFNRAADRVCRRCTLCAGCWERDYMTTADSLGGAGPAMLRRGRAEAADFPKHFSSRCVKFPEFLRATNEAMFALQQKREYQEKCEQNRSLLAQQYAGLTGILRQLGTGGAGDVTTLPARERQVRRYAAAFGQIDRVAVYRDGNRRLRIELGGEGLERILEQKEGFTAGLAALLSVGLSEPEQLSDELGARLLLREQAPFRAVVGIGQRKKAGENVSGDTARYFVTEDGRACLTLSDGMGTGEGAARDSSSVLRQMERFLQAGVSAADALRAIAPAYRLQCEGKRFVTLDVLTIDLFSGRAESLKCGAAPSYLRTGGGVTRIVSSTLPVGLAEDDGETVPLRLGHGDLYVLLTDGVSDGIDDEWVHELLRTRMGDSPKELAAKLVAAATERGMTDDMTAFVLRIERV
ncbi:MAG: hypothetical protein EOM63_05570 [Clostridia bacterium]|nr:hypothetical protein [Clostridia bacterium]